MGRIATAVVLASLCTVPLAWAAPPPAITPTSIAGVKLGISRAKARSLLGKYVRADRLEAGYDRLVDGGQKVEVYFHKGAKGAGVVTTWNRNLRTDKRIGPCTAVAALRRAYGKKLVPFRQKGRVVAYRLADLTFTVGRGKRIGVVGLGKGTAAVWVALNAPACG